jgi:hypothetical protein
VLATTVAGPVAAPTALAPAPAGSRGAPLGLVAGGVGLVLAGLGLGVMLLRGGGGSSTPASQAATQAPSSSDGAKAGLPSSSAAGSGEARLAAASASPAAPAGATKPEAGKPVPPPDPQARAVQTIVVPVITDPPGASVSVDGVPVKGTTPLDLTLDGAKDHRVAVSRDSYATQETTLAAGKGRTELRLRLDPAGPLASVTVASSYPIDVAWRGRSLSRGTPSPRVQLPGGRHVLLVSSATHFVRAEIVVTAAAGGEVTVEAPALGRLSIRANPDTCQVFIDGVFVDYPPILDKAVGAGPHEVSFKWPDGHETKETVEVPAGKVAFVSGRK